MSAGEWGGEWGRWATTGGDWAKALDDIIGRSLGHTPSKDLPLPATRSDTAAIPRQEGADLATGEVAGPRAHGRPIMAALLAASMIAAGGLGGAGLWRTHELHAAEASCAAAAEAYRLSLSKRTKAVEGWRALKPGQQDDPTAVARLEREARQAVEPVAAPAPCQTGGRDALNSRARRMEKAAAANDESAASMENGIGAIRRQRDARAAALARNGLVDEQGRAMRLYDSSAGNVADDATRQSLRKAIRTADRAIKAGSGVKAVDAESGRLQKAMDAVNASMSAKAAADADAAQAQARQQAGNQAPAAPLPAPVAPERQRPAAPRQPAGNGPSQVAPTTPTAPGGGWYVPPSGGDGGLPDHL